MAPQPTRDSARTLLTSAGVGAAALVLTAAAGAPALADNNGNHYGQTQDHASNSHAAAHGQSTSPNGHSTSNSAASGQDPAGNNGTVFIHDVAGDHSPHNVPHVSCTFYVDFFGFDANQDVDVSFAGQAPTGKDMPLGGSQTLAPVSDDAAGGAGQDWDNEITVTADELGVQNLGAPAHQGYHVKMTVVTNQPGNHKYKVFWLQPCTTASTPQSSTTPTNESSTGTEVEATNVTNASNTPQTSSAGQTSAGQTSAGQTSGGALAPAQATRSSSGIPTEVLGRSITRSGATPAAAPAAGSLPFTGAEIGGLAAAAALLLGGGTALTVAGRRRRSQV